MLPSELARYKINGQNIIPLFASTDDINIASDVINTFRVGRKVGDILEDIKYLSKIYDYKLVKGLAKIYLRYCKIETENKIDFRELRRQLFIRGPVLDNESRAKVIEEVRNIFSLDDPIKVIYEDLDEEKKIIELFSISPEDLIKLYNLSLLQTIFFNAYKITVYIKENWKNLIRRIKFLGLMYLAYDNPLRIEIFGPLTLLKMTEKYGRNLAVLVPYIVLQKEWKIIANIVLGKQRRMYRLELSNLSEIFKYIRDEEAEKRFDSTVEEKFYNEFRKVIKDWQILREPEQFVVDNRLFIPDFVAIKGNLKIYIEIAGFWTKQYIHDKMQKLKKFNYPVLVLLNDELSYDNYIPDDLNIIKFKRKIDIAKVYLFLKKFKENKTGSDVDLGNLKDDIISIRELSEKYGVDEKIIRSKLALHQDYVVLKNYAIKKAYLNELSMNDFSNQHLSNLIKQYGNYILDVLDYFGYSLVWKNIEDALVVKRSES
ncbi:MAG: DUF790 family protein [Saccharolobus sp.]